MLTQKTVHQINCQTEDNNTKLGAADFTTVSSYHKLGQLSVCIKPVLITLSIHCQDSVE